jgi:OmpA-OmpF porin, OOP family
MKTYSIVAVTMISGGLLAGCAGLELDKARDVSPTGSAFAQKLHSGYVAIADAEYAEADFTDSDRFAARAIQAAAGKPPGPEELSMRKLPKNKLGELTDARNRLVFALSAGGRKKAPDAAANAQVMFDCWMQEQEENFQPEDINKCRAGFMSSIAQVEAALAAKPVKIAAPAKPMMKAKEKPKMMAPDVQRQYVVYFGFDSTALTPAAQKVIARIAANAKRVKVSRVLITGYTDRAGSGRYNLALSEKRTAAVADALAKAGLSPRSFTMGALGENNPAITTKDGQRNEINRRVVISLMK